MLPDDTCKKRIFGALDRMTKESAQREPEIEKGIAEYDERFAATRADPPPAPDLLTATTEAEIVRAVARLCWKNDQCPAKAIPAIEKLDAWLLEHCPDEAKGQANELLTHVYPKDGVVWWEMQKPPPPNVSALCVIIQGTSATANKLSWSGTQLVIYTDVVTIEEVHDRWLNFPENQRSTHPLTPLVEAWQRRPSTLAAAITNATGKATNMTRRVQLVSTMCRVPWTLDAEVSAAHVDGEPMATPLPDPAGLFPQMKRRPRTRFKPGEQRMLKLPTVPSIPTDLRLLALQEVSADPHSSPVLPGDVLTLLTFAHVADRPLILTEREGAALLVRDRSGRYRAVQRHDYKRFWEAADRLRTLAVFDPAGTGKWVNLATVEVPSTNPVDRVIIGPPAWAHGTHVGKWTLTAEGSAAAAARVTAGKQSRAGRVVTGIEYRLAAGWNGHPNTIAPDLLPANDRRKTGPGRPVEIDWRNVLRYAGEWWDETDPKADKAALECYNRVVATLMRRGYFVPGSLLAEAPAGDSVEIVCRVRAARGRRGGLQVRAAARFVQAARLAQQPQGAGFRRLLLTDWAGLPPTDRDKDRAPLR